MGKIKRAQISPEDPPVEAYTRPEEFLLRRTNYDSGTEIIGVSGVKSENSGYLGDINNRRNDPFFKALEYFGEFNSKKAHKKINGLRKKLLRGGLLKSRKISLDKFYKKLEDVDFEFPLENLWEFVKGLSGPPIHYGGGSLTLDIYERKGEKRVKIRDHPGR